MAADIIDVIWNELKQEINALNQRVTKVETFTEQAGFSDGVPAYTVASLPSSGLANGQSFVTIAFASNGRKSGEGAGSGTGVPVYWDAASSQWLKFSDNTAVTS